MLEDFIADMTSLLRILATLGFITVGGFIIGIEYKFYKEKLDDTRGNKILFFIVAILTVLVWLYMYFVIFNRFNGS